VVLPWPGSILQIRRSQILARDLGAGTSQVDARFTAGTSQVGRLPAPRSSQQRAPTTVIFRRCDRPSHGHERCQDRRLACLLGCPGTGRHCPAAAGTGTGRGAYSTALTGTESLLIRGRTAAGQRDRRHHSRGLACPCWAGVPGDGGLRLNSESAGAVIRSCSVPGRVPCWLVAGRGDPRDWPRDRDCADDAYATSRGRRDRLARYTSGPSQVYVRSVRGQRGPARLGAGADRS